MAQSWLFDDLHPPVTDGRVDLCFTSSFILLASRVPAMRHVPVEAGYILVGDEWRIGRRRWWRRGTGPTWGSETFQSDRCFTHGRLRRRCCSWLAHVLGVFGLESPEECKDSPGVACGKCLIQQLLPYHT